MKFRRIGGAVVVAALGLTLTGGCTASKKSASSAAGDVAQPQASEAAAAGVARAPAAEAKTASVESRSFVVSASVSLVTRKVDDAANRVSALGPSNGGRVDGDERSRTGTDRTATLTLRVLPARLNSVISAVDRLGSESSRTLRRDDVTASKADVDARVSALATSVSRLQHLLGTAGSVTTLLRVETALTSRQAQLDSLRAQQRALNDQVALATLTVYLRAKATAPVKHHFRATGFGAAVGSSIHGLGVATLVLIAAVGYVLPEAVLLALLAAVALVWRRRRHGSPPTLEEPAAGTI